MAAGRRDRAAVWLFVAAALAFFGSAAGGWAQQAPAPVGQPLAVPPSISTDQLPSYTSYGRVEAGWEAYQRAEAQRRQAIARQLQTIDSMVWYSGLPGYRYPPSLASIYANPWGWSVASSRVIRPYRHPFPAHRFYVFADPFEPWPIVPGDIYGYPYVDRVEQPVGHQVIVTGPGGYIYRPVYAWELAPNESGRASGVSPSRPASPPASAPVPPPPPTPALPPAEPLPVPPAQSGPREF